jgi:hypothetical protein
MDNAAVKEILSTPVGMLMLMLAASLLGGIKHIIVAKQAGAQVSLSKYLQFWPETSAVLIGNIIAFVVLILTDQLNFASALGIGYGVNSAADLLRPGGRSDSGTVVTKE